MMLTRIFSGLEKFDRLLKGRSGRMLDYYPQQLPKPRGRVLVSYLSRPMTFYENDPRFRGHSNLWESREIVRIFNRLGFSVDVINFDDVTFVPRTDYSAVFDIHGNLTRYSTSGTVKILHVTGSNPSFSNIAEQQRIDELSRRRGGKVIPRRQAEEETFLKSLYAADMITLIGNKVTASTFPDAVHEKLRRTVATGSYLPAVREINLHRIKNREFLWFNGSGAVHKGLDITLDFFSKNKDIVLHVIGPYKNETDFYELYRKELTGSENIISHGFVYPGSRKFRNIVRDVIAFINPSCSEGISTAAVTCMQYGIIPVMSRNCGIDLNESAGFILPVCSEEKIGETVDFLCTAEEGKILQLMKECQQYSLRCFSRSEFSHLMECYISEALSKGNLL